MKTLKKFAVLAGFVAILLVGVRVFGNEGTIRNAANAVVNWVCTSMGLTAPNIF